MGEADFYYFTCLNNRNGVARGFDGLLFQQDNIKNRFQTRYIPARFSTTARSNKTLPPFISFHHHHQF